LFGHGLSNLKDTAQVTMVLTSLYYLVRATKDTKLNKKDFLIGAVVFGLGLATKFNAVYVPIIWGIWYFVTARKNIVFTVRYVLFIGIVGLVTMFSVWPYLWFDTVPRVIEVVKYFTTIGQGFRVIWDGTWYIVGTGKSLWWYPLLSFFYTTPLILLVLMFFGGILLVRDRKKHPICVLLPIWILVPLLRTVSPRSAFYDLTRHFMEILPATLLVAAIGLEWFFQKKQHLRTTGIMVAVIILGYMFYINVSMFPYSTGYYNILAQDPNTNFDRDIEGFSVKEGMDFLHRSYGPVKVWVPIAAHLSWPYLTSVDQYIYMLENGPDSIIIVNKQTHGSDNTRLVAQQNHFTLVHTISRGKAVFGWVYRRTSK
jgi:4-amino-4-deoxy-L-arabinose transferase-like glycosyltransferase